MHHKKSKRQMLHLRNTRVIARRLRKSGDIFNMSRDSPWYRIIERKINMWLKNFVK